MSRTDEEREFTSIEEIRKEFFPESARQRGAELTVEGSRSYGRQVAERLLDKFRARVKEEGDSE